MEVFPADNPEVMVQAIEKLGLAEPEEPGQISVHFNDQSLDYLEKGASVVRSLEIGEMDLIAGRGIPRINRKYDPWLSARLRDDGYGKQWAFDDLACLMYLQG